jgi:uncharacterized protein YdhG (YjbR/CyaY superfamily)
MRESIPEDIKSYISKAPKEVRAKLVQFRRIIKTTVPDAVEGISYGMPCYKYYKRVLVYFAAFKNHVSIFPGPDAIAAFKKELSSYKTSKGTIQFQLDKPLPLGLIKKIVAYRAKENAAKAP